MSKKGKVPDPYILELKQNLKKAQQSPEYEQMISELQPQADRQAKREKKLWVLSGIKAEADRQRHAAKKMTDRDEIDENTEASEKYANDIGGIKPQYLVMPESLITDMIKEDSLSDELPESILCTKVFGNNVRKILIRKPIGEITLTTDDPPFLWKNHNIAEITFFEKGNKEDLENSCSFNMKEAREGSTDKGVRYVKNFEKHGPSYIFDGVVGLSRFVEPGEGALPLGEDSMFVDEEVTVDEVQEKQRLSAELAKKQRSALSNYVDPDDDSIIEALTGTSPKPPLSGSSLGGKKSKKRSKKSKKRSKKNKSNKRRKTSRKLNL